MQLETDRLILKEVNENHVNDILKIRSNALINQYVRRNSPKTNYDALDFILSIKKRVQNKEVVFLGISYKNQQNLMGTICLLNFSQDKKSAEIGYELLPEYHKMGIMSEAMKCVLNYGFNELELQKILAVTGKTNEGSKSLLLKHGFVLEKDRADEGLSQDIIFGLKKNI